MHNFNFFPFFVCRGEAACSTHGWPTSSTPTSGRWDNDDILNRLQSFTIKLPIVELVTAELLINIKQLCFPPKKDIIN